MKPAFPDIKKIAYEGPKSKNPLAFKHYNPDEVVEGKTMRDHLRFSVAYWHTFRNGLARSLRLGTALRPWDDGTNSVENAATAAASPSSSSRSSAPPSTRSTIATSPPKAATLTRINKNLDAVVKVLKEEQERTGIKLLWGTAASSPTRATCTARPPAATPTSSPTPPRR